jgi:probable DNA metabolism protein
LSELEDCCIWILEYLRLGFRLGAKIDFNLADDRVLKVHNASRKVLAERHRMLGLLRFADIGQNTYFAPMEPVYNIAAILAPHFAERLSGQNWIIYDVRRKLAAVYDREKWCITEDAFLNQYVDVSAKEADYRELWKQYFNNIAIKSRVNPKLQKQFMPMRYWKYLVEKSL